MSLWNNAYMSDEELRLANEENNETHFYSRFEFLKSHAGIRPGQLHLIVGTTGSGKSTLTRSLIADCAETRKVFVFLSEESTKDYRTSLNAVTRNQKIYPQVKICSEQDMPPEYREDIDQFHFYLGEKIMDSGAEVVFLDNLTTSQMYSNQVSLKNQSRTISWIRRFSVENNLPFFIVAHTKKGMVDNSPHLIGLEDIRGSQEISNFVAYGYVMQTLMVNGDRFPFIRVQKHRYHPKSGGYYLLAYDNGVYVGDRKVPFEKVAKIFKGTDRFTR